MTYRVVLWGTGNVGTHAITGIEAFPETELVGLYVNSPDKVGKDAGELAGLDRKLGIIATNDEQALFALKPDCIVHCAASDSRPVQAVADFERFLRAGINVSSTGPVSAIYPAADESGFTAGLQKAALEAGKSVWVNGLDPGFANDILPMQLTSMCRRIDKVHCIEIFNYATYNQPATLRVMGFGEPPEVKARLETPGALTGTFGPGVRQIAKGLGIELDEIKEFIDRAFAPEDFDTVVPIKKGTGAGLRFRISGMKDGKEVAVIEHVTRMRDDIAPEWPQPAGTGSYSIKVIGDPSFTLDLQMHNDSGEHVDAANLATAMRIITAVPAVVEAAPGHLSIYDLPLITGVGMTPYS